MDTKHPEKEKNRPALLSLPNEVDLKLPKHDASAIVSLRNRMSITILERISEKCFRIANDRQRDLQSAIP